jgi:hypothetical protein
VGRPKGEDLENARLRRKQLIDATDKSRGALLFPWSYGVVLTHISRRQFDANVLSANRQKWIEALRETL